MTSSFYASIDKKRLICRSGKNIRTGADGYTWGKPLANSHIISEKEALGLGFSENMVIAERWICADDKMHPSFVATDTEEILPLHTLLEKTGDIILGHAHLAAYGPFLGTIMKLIDTSSVQNKGSLSLQVHPPIGYPTLPAKPEMWLSLDDASSLYVGFQRDVTAEEIRSRVKDNSIFEILHKIPFPKHHKLLIPGGILHAIRYQSFLAEWSKSPTREDAKTGGLKYATSTLSDRTDGKTPRPGKENMQQSLNIMEYANHIKKTELSNLYPDKQILYQDIKGNTIQKLFTTDVVVVQELTVVDTLTFHVDQALSFFVYHGHVDISHASETLTVISGAEFICPIYIKKMYFKNHAPYPSRLFCWHKPLP